MTTADATDSPLDELRARRDAIHRSLANTAEQRAAAHAAVASAVATTGTAPAEWPTDSTKHDRDAQALELGAKEIEQHIHAEVGAIRLAIAKLENGRRNPILARLNDLYSNRSALGVTASNTAATRAPFPSDLLPRLLSTEEELAGAITQLAAVDREIATTRAPLNRYEAEEIQRAQRADLARVA